MSLILNGTTGISDVDGTAAAPALTGTDSNTGIFFPTADTIAFAEGGVEAVRIDSSGNVGIGTSSPTRKLTIAGTGAFSSTAAPSIRLDDTASSRLALIDFDSSQNLNVWAGTDTGTIRFLTNTGAGTERARIDSSGNLLVGTTSVDAAGSKVQLSSFQNRVFTIQNTANANGDQALWIKLGSNCNTTASPALICDTGGTNRLVIYGNGNVQNTNNSYGAISDIKLKENIVDATPKLADLMQVKVRNYNLIGDTTKQIGVVAQELETIFPALVDESFDRNQEGDNLGTTTKSVKYSVFVPMLIKAIQEQQALITALTARITALEAI